MRSKETLICTVAAALLIYAVFSLVKAGHELDMMRQEAASVGLERAALEAENRELLRRLDEETSDEQMQQLARERLALLLPGERVYYFLTDREEQPWNWQSGRYCRGRSPVSLNSALS